MPQWTDAQRPESIVNGTACLESEDFSRLFGIAADGMPEPCRALIAKGDFQYRMLDAEERDRVLADVHRRLDTGQFSEAGKDGRPRWEAGWAENLAQFRQGDRDLSQLVPKYIRARQPVRLYRNYATPVDQNFELRWYEVFQQWLFTSYFRDASAVYEFGCGSGINLAALGSMYPEKRFVGLDWAASSRDIVDEMAAAFGWNMKGQLFDFFHPDRNLTIDDGAVVLTIGALEQTGRDYEAFVQYLIEMSPALCVHIEPVVEWYESEHPVDYAAIRFHRARKYWEGFPARLKELEEQGRAEVIKLKRSEFGSLYLEGYSQLIWRPVRQRWI